jgi:hypothetical protein
MFVQFACVAVVLTTGLSPVRYIERWRPIVEKVVAEYPELEPEIVLSIIAQESSGRPAVISTDGYGSIGLMQISPKPWRGTVTELSDPETNIRMGTAMLVQILSQAGGDMRTALAAYNCGWKVLTTSCGSHGGYNYADRILEHWLPQFTVQTCTERDLERFSNEKFGEVFGNHFGGSNRLRVWDVVYWSSFSRIGRLPIH